MIDVQKTVLLRFEGVLGTQNFELILSLQGAP